MLIPSLNAQIYSDTTWERWFFGPPHYETTTGVKHVEYYDKGYLLGTSFGEDWGEYAKLIKPILTVTICGIEHLILWYLIA
jgi:hypothetical protein